MNFGYLKFVVVLALVERTWSLPLACPYNGTSYKEGESVTTEEPCLSCICQKGALECSLRVCADYPNVLPPGCFLVHKPNDCCPQLFCEESFNPGGVELRTDYKLQNTQNGNDCVINGSIYAEGSALASSQPCEYCYCVEGKTKCIKPQCLQTFEGCTAVYEKSSCCPTHYDCRNADVNLLRNQIRNYVSANIDSTISNNTLRSLSDFDLESGNDDFNVSAEDLTEKAEEVVTVATESANTLETTAVSETEVTTTVEEDRPTTLGFQTVKTEELIRESTTPPFQVDTTQPPDMTTTFQSTEGENKQNSDVIVRNNLNFSEPIDSSPPPIEGSRDNSSQEVDDYDAYDYNEPQLPPSLPNLVIFPFVAADAVVKSETPDLPDTYDKAEIKRIDSHPVIYKDLFSPPIKTEGGFVPKEPSTSDEPFYDYVYYRKEQIESPGPGHGTICQDVGCSLSKADTDFTAFVDQQNTKATAGDLTPTPDPFGVVPTDFVFKEKTKKPVTVTYKNVVVDFYPSYLITTTRYHPKIQSVETSQKEQLNEASEADIFEVTNTPPKTVPLTAEATAVTTIETVPTIRTTTIQSSFLDEFFKSFLSEEIISTTTITNTKHKYSSKIKGQPATTTFNRKPELGTDLRPKAEGSASSLTEKTKIYNATRKQVKKEGIKSFSKAPFNHLSAQEEKTNEKVELSDSLASAALRTEIKKPEKEEGGGNRAKVKEGALLKLAGCNIYGMMYRVGKVITELSGPCLECLCTDLGVQCRPLKC